MIHETSNLGGKLDSLRKRKVLAWPSSPRQWRKRLGPPKTQPQAVNRAKKGFFLFSFRSIAPRLNSVPSYLVYLPQDH